MKKPIIDFKKVMDEQRGGKLPPKITRSIRFDESDIEYLINKGIDINVFCRDAIKALIYELKKNDGGK